MVARCRTGYVLTVDKTCERCGAEQGEGCLDPEMTVPNEEDRIEIAEMNEALAAAKAARAATLKRRLSSITRFPAKSLDAGRA